MSRNAWVGQHPGKEDSRLVRISPYFFGAHGLSNIHYLPKLRDLPCCGLDFKSIVFDFGFAPGTQSLPPTGAAKQMIPVERPLLIWGISAIGIIVSTGGGGGGGGGVANWHAATTYGLNDRVLVVEKELQGPLFHQTWVIVGWTLYVSLQAGNTGNNPPDSPAWWGTGSSPFDAASSGYHFQILHSHQGNQRQLFSKFMTPTESAGIAGLPLLLKTPYMVIRGDELTCQVRNVQVIPSALQVQVVLFGGEFD